VRPTRKCNALPQPPPACRSHHMDPGQLYQVKVAQNAAFEEPGLMRPALKPLLKFEFCPKFNIFESFELHLPSL
jgi:hypothetical protein